MLEPQLQKSRAGNHHIVHFVHIDQVAAMHAQEPLFGQTFLQRRDGLAHQIGAVRRDGMGIVGARLDVADIGHGDEQTLAAALAATCRKRDSEKVLPEYRGILDEIEANTAMREFWKSYQKKNSYAADITWKTVMNAIRVLCDRCIS